MTLLKFSNGNSKLAPNIFTFSLPAGYACPGAHECKSQAVQTPDGFRLKDGPACQFRCFAALDEALKPNVRLARWHNFNLLKGKTKAEMVSLIQASLPTVHWKYIVRLHVSGDFFNQSYFDAWMEVAERNPGTLFYGYTKSLLVWKARNWCTPGNMKLVASRGGKWDCFIERYHLRNAKVVFSEAEAAELGLQIDHDDSLAYGSELDFALLLHGSQPANSPAAKAWSALKLIGKGGYHNQKRGRGWGGKDYTGAKYKVPTGGGTPAPAGMLRVSA